MNESKPKLLFEADRVVRLRRVDENGKLLNTSYLTNEEAKDVYTSLQDLFCQGVVGQIDEAHKS